MSAVRFLDRWTKLTDRVGISADSLGLQLLNRYKEPHRVYHGVNHIIALLRQFDDVRHTMRWPNLVELALFGHDAIYDLPESLGHNPRNEARSAAFMDDALLQAGLDAMSARYVGSLIRATDHSEDPGEHGARILCDIDMAILGAQPLEYDVYAQQVRDEFVGSGLVSPKEYAVGRQAFLHGQLRRDTFFHNEHFVRWYDALARENMKREIQVLKDDA